MFVKSFRYFIETARIAGAFSPGESCVPTGRAKRSSRAAEPDDRTIWGFLFWLLPEILANFWPDRSVHNSSFNRVLGYGTGLDREISKNDADCTSQKNICSSDDLFQTLFHFFRELPQKIVDFSQIKPFHRRFAPFSRYPSKIDPKTDPKMSCSFGETRSI